MFHEYSKILVPVDGSDEARLAYDKAIEVAKRNNAHLYVTHVIDTRSLHSPTGFESEFTEELQRQADLLFEEYTEIAKQRGLTDVETILEFGSPKVLISKNIPKQYDIELIMIGATGLNAVERLFIGSVSEYVIRNAACDVMVVRTDLENQLPPKQDEA